MQFIYSSNLDIVIFENIRNSVIAFNPCKIAMN